MAFDYEIEIRDTSDNLVDLLKREVTSLSWRYDSIGGCGDCQISLSRLFDDYGPAALDYDVKIIHKQAGVADEIRWNGFIRQIVPTLEEPEHVIFECAGYIRQAEYTVIDNQLYGSQDVGAIARTIIDSYLVPNTRILRTGGLNLCQNAGVTASASGLRFFNSAFDALKSLAEIGANAEWGVRADKQFYFLPRSSAVKQTWVIGDRIKMYQPKTSTDDLVHRLYVQSADGSIMTANGPNQPANGHYKKMRVIGAAALTNTTDATLLATSYFAKYNSQQPKGQVRLTGVDWWIENISGQSMPPLGRVRLQGGPFWSGTAVFGGNTDTTFRIDSITYAPDENGLNIQVDLGEKRGMLSDLFRAIEYKLSDARQGTQPVTNPPAVPSNLNTSTGVIVPEGDGTPWTYFGLTWNANTEWDIDSYIVEIRNTTDNLSATLVYKHVPGESTFTVRQPAAGYVGYQARIRAVNRSWLFSDWSDWTTPIATAKDTDAPDHPTALSISAGFECNVLTWTNPTDPDFAGIEIWRAPADNWDLAEKIADTTATFFIDGGLQDTSTWYYWIRAVDRSGNISTLNSQTGLTAGQTQTTIDTEQVAADAITTTVAVQSTAEVNPTTEEEIDHITITADGNAVLICTISDMMGGDDSTYTAYLFRIRKGSASGTLLTSQHVTFYDSFLRQPMPLNAVDSSPGSGSVSYYLTCELLNGGADFNTIYTPFLMAFNLKR